MKRITAALAASALLALSAPAVASPPPPTEGGNGAGSSGQCTGKSSERPLSCKTRGGPGDQP